MTKSKTVSRTDPALETDGETRGLWDELIEIEEKDLEIVQGITAYRIGGAEVPRVPFGEETVTWEAERCKCRARKGQLHLPGCDYEMCGRCRGQVTSCSCGHEFKEDGDPEEDCIEKEQKERVSEEGGYADLFGRR